jgi:hypothetical protein
MVQLEQKDDILDLFVELLRDQIWDLHQGLHGLVLGDTVPLQDGEVLLDLLLGLAQNGWVLHEQVLHDIEGEAHLFAHHLLEREDTSLVVLVLILIQQQSWLHPNNMSHFLSIQAELVHNLLLSGHHLLKLHVEESNGEVGDTVTAIPLAHTQERGVGNVVSWGYLHIFLHLH